jgi:multidrug resistance efflux pump
MAELQFAEANAMTELVELQTRITSAPLHAPADGYVVRHLYAVGATTKKRKPLLTFVEAKKLVLEATVPAAQAAPFAAGADVKVVSMIDPAQAFLGRVESATPAGEAVALRIRPAALPFLTLGTTTPVTLSAAR